MSDGLRGVRGPRRVVVVGGGLAGHTAAATLRAEGYDGGLTVLGAEPDPPYDRPPLSKELLDGTTDDTTLDTDLLDTDLDVDLRLRCRAVRLRPDAVESTGGVHPYDAVVLATGSSPLRLGGTSRAVHALRTVADARRLRAALRDGASVAVVGAGWIGNEVATRAAALDRKVTVIDAAPTPLARALPAAVGERLVPWYAERGIDLRLSTPVTGVDDRGVALADGGRVDADIVVAGIGARPDTDWLRGSGVPLAPDGAVDADATLRTGPGPVYVAGDIVRWPSRLFGGRLRVEHWDHAAASARTAARNVLGRAEPYDPVPYFWSDQLGHRLQYVGHHDGADRLVLRGRPPGSWTALWFRGGRLRAALAVDDPRDVRDARRLIAARRPLSAERAADPAVRLTDAAG
ncbi:NAD(P)/FAD-dependent oxidoreductase [Actinomadura chibensis]|uniref:NAD(P)/FAD-dependent oxidoreductase n=1 Tax=Actinomadura chibensis TaxID=392828 RepID=UPI000B019B88|nr:FAD-dependent oxidoreductase [Actinomadura chibensis]